MRMRTKPRNRTAELLAPPNRLYPTTLGRLSALGSKGEAWITVDDAKPCQARTTVELTAGLVGREVLVCVAGKRKVPVVVGVLRKPGDAANPAAVETLDLVVDRQRITLSAQKEIVLRCGEATLSLTADGKVAIRGADVVTTAARTNRIRGGAVRIN